MLLPVGEDTGNKAPSRRERLTFGRAVWRRRHLLALITVRGAARPATQPRRRRGAALPERSTTWLASHLLLTLMILGLVSSDFGKVRVRTPFSKTASALPASTATFSVSVREKVPYGRS